MGCIAFVNLLSTSREMSPTETRVRIGELSRRVGVPPELLRAWERRYGLLAPDRTGGGLRLYSAEDEARVRRMQAFLAEGLAAGEAAGAALRAAPARAPEATALPGTPVEERLEALDLALESFDAVSAQRTFDALQAELSLDPFLTQVVLPFLRRLGERWALGDVSVAQEHFASNLLRDRIHSLAQGWDAGAGPRALLACPPGESHHLGLSCFGLALRARGWRITFLGAETPFETILDTVASLAPDLTVMSAVDPARFAAAEGQLTELATATPLALAGAGAGTRIAERVGARLLEADPVSAADLIAGEGRLDR
jgi:DNA-binding transcriptional MerR regulator